MATFSLVVSACISTRTKATSAGNLASSASAFRKGSSIGVMKTRPCRFKMANFTPFFAVPTVVAAGQYLDPHSEQLVRKTRRDTEAGCRIFAVSNDQVDLPLRDDIRQPVLHDLPARRTYNVADEKYAHFVCCSCFCSARFLKGAPSLEHKKWSGLLGRGD